MSKEELIDIVEGIISHPTCLKHLTKQTYEAQKGLRKEVKAIEIKKSNYKRSSSDKTAGKASSIDISAITTTYLEEDYIEKTLKRLDKAKCFAELDGIESEILVVDSGDDKTFDIAKDIADKVFRFKERGFSKARNFGALKASGRILLFTDADVRVPENWFKEAFGTFRDVRTVAAVSYTVPYKSLHLSPSERMFYKLDHFYIKACAKLKPLLRFYSRGDGLAIRKNAFRKVGGFN